MTDSNTSTPNPAPELVDSSAFGVAYRRRLAEIKAVPESEFVRLNLDIYSAVVTVLGALPKIKALAPQIAKLPLDHKLVDGLEDYAGATAEASSRFVIAKAPEREIVALYEDALQRRETLRVDATALAHHGLIDPRRLSVFKGLTGYKNVAFELIAWASLMGEVWPEVEGKTALTADDIRQAKDVGEKLVRAAGLREVGPAVVAETAVIRRQAFTLLFRAWDEVRRAVCFLRWKQGDADSIAPSFYLGRAKGRRARSDKPQAQADATAPAEPAAATADARPTNGAARPTNGAARPTNGAARPTNGAAVRTAGMPGTSLFVN